MKYTTLKPRTLNPLKLINMTQATRSIWIVVFGERSDKRTQRVAAYNLPEVLSYFNEEGQKKIVKIEKTEDEVTFKY